VSSRPLELNHPRFEATEELESRGEAAVALRAGAQ